MNVENIESEFISNLDINLVVRNPKQPRKIFDEEALKELSKSIESNGVIQPIW